MGDQGESLTPRCALWTARNGYYVLDVDRAALLERVEAAVDGRGWITLETVSVEGHRFAFSLLASEVRVVDEVTPERWEWVLRETMDAKARAGVHEEALRGMQRMADSVAREIGEGDPDE